MSAEIYTKKESIMANQSSNEAENELVSVVVLDREGYWWGRLNEDAATTLIAVASEDPADWSELVACWPRYTTRAVPEFASSLLVDQVPRDKARMDVATTDSWIVLDLVQKRFLSGKSFPLTERDARFAMHTDENGDQHDPLSVHLPPWWELHEQVDASQLDQPRCSPVHVPFVDREVLFGQPLVQDLAKRILQSARTDRWRKAIQERKLENNRPLYNLTVEVHRDWLMTPREDLSGMYPRQMLHGGIDWIDKIVWGHRIRFERGGGPMVALPAIFSGCRTGPMGREEVAIYFDLCRELIEAGWHWCERNIDALDAESLVGFLNDVKTDWLHASFEGDSPPAFILECSRRRVPRGVGVQIVGMDERQTEEHVIDCDCPICQMMADGMFGIGFTAIDGHHLELDDEFAFSLHETREAWEAEQCEWAEQSTQWDREREERERKLAEGELEEDEFASAWSGHVSDEPIPGDSSGSLQLAFLLAEVVGELQHEAAPSELVRKLNDDFSAFRKSSPEGLSSAARDLAATLESVAGEYPTLVSRVGIFKAALPNACELPFQMPMTIPTIPCFSNECRESPKQGQARFSGLSVW